ncbi:MAG: DUF4129 domain-containing protein [Leeuwenhoekiella sp.]
MPYLLRTFYFSLLSCYSLAGQSVAQDSSAVREIQYDLAPVNPLPVDDDAMSEYLEDSELDYTEIEPEDNWYTRTLRWFSDLYDSIIQWLLGGEEATGFLKFVIEAIPYLIVFGVVLFLVWLFMKIDTSGSPLIGNKPGEVILSSEQEIIENKDIQQLIDEALAQKNYRLAVRYSYLLILQKLSQKEIINWQVQKTNHDYVYEIKDDSLKTQFAKVTRIYDFIWYGNFEVDDSAFAKAKQEFTKLTTAL